MIGNLSIDTIKSPKTYVKSIAGGAVGAAACAAAFNNQKVGIVSKVGKDFQDYFGELLSHNVDIEGIKVVEGRTTRFEMTYDRNFDLKKINEIWGKSTDLNLSDIPKNYLGAKCFHICPNSPVLHSLFLKLKRKGVIMSLDPHMLYRHEIAKKMLSRFNIITPNEKEAISMSGEKNVWKAAKNLAKYGTKIVIITRGNKGSILYLKEFQKYIEVPAVYSKVLDTTGCGDTWNGAFLSEYIKTKKIENSALLASVLASFTAEKNGAFMPKITKNQVEERLKKIKNLLLKNNSKRVIYSKEEKKFVVD